MLCPILKIYKCIHTNAQFNAFGKVEMSKRKLLTFYIQMNTMLYNKEHWADRKFYIFMNHILGSHHLNSRKKNIKIK